MDKQKIKEALFGGLNNNPVFILVIGMCPVIAQSNTIIKAFSLGAATAIVLIISNVVVSFLRNFIPDKVRIPCYITIVATITVVIMLLMESYLNDLYQTLGSFLALVAVNCIIMARLETYASKNAPIYTVLDSVSMGLGFVFAITTLGVVRQLLTMAKFDIFATTAGGFIVLGFMIAAFTSVSKLINDKLQKRKQVVVVENCTSAREIV
ncbi:MAG: electron transport complex subunit RsxE [Clostridiales bacterium]|jgi:electron transport complex protein RnfE|nr:electron transport complex subunit RsxE [Clostridiales bacterium]